MAKLIAAWVAIMAVTAAGAADKPAKPNDPGAAVRQKAAADLDAALKSADITRVRVPADRLALLKAAGAAVVKAVPGNVTAAEMVAAAEKKADPTTFRIALEKVYGILTFEVSFDAEMPDGYPAPTPAGEVRVQAYPSYRLAKTPSGPSKDGFSTLFDHIQKRNMAMTVPVELTYAGNADKPTMTEMAFLYRTSKQGEPGKTGAVEVVNVPAMTAVSLGVRGSHDPAKPLTGLTALRDWLKRHPAYTEAGPVRVLRYNAPTAPSDTSFYEVQIPVKKAAE